MNGPGRHFATCPACNQAITAADNNSACPESSRADGKHPIFVLEYDPAIARLPVSFPPEPTSPTDDVEHTNCYPAIARLPVSFPPEPTSPTDDVEHTNC